MRLTLLAAIICSAIIAGLSVYAVAQNVNAKVKWIVTIPSQVYVGEPILIKVYAYNPATLRVYNVACNLTVTNGTDIILLAHLHTVRRQRPDPVIARLYLPREGSYSIEMYCVVPETGDIYATTRTVKVIFPEPKVTVRALWGRLPVLNISLPHTYSRRLNFIVYWRGEKIHAYIPPGSNMTQVVLPEPITEPGRATISLFYKNITVPITPVPPRISIMAPETMYVNTSSTILVRLVDDYGVLDIYPVNMSVSGPCHIDGGGKSISGFTNSKYLLVADGEGVCNVTAYTLLWPGKLINKTVSVRLLVPEPNITLHVSNTTSWDYCFEVNVSTPIRVLGDVVLSIDGSVVSAKSSYSSVFGTRYCTTLTPGEHLVTVKVTYMNKTFTRRIRISIPKRPYTITPPPPVIYAGDKIEINAAWYQQILPDGSLNIIAYYPGDDYYLPARRVFHVRVIYPDIRVNGTHLIVMDAAPNAKVTVYCVSGGKELLLGQFNVHGRFLYKLPSTCSRFKIVYRYKSYTEVVYGKTPARVKILSTTCRAGEPCILVAPSPKILHVSIGNMLYKPGTPVRLKPGVYTLRVFLTDGSVVEETVTVKPVRVTLVIEPYQSLWRVRVYGPPYVDVAVVLPDGSILRLHPGTYTLWAKPVTVYWEYGNVKVIYKGELEYVPPWGPRR